MKATLRLLIVAAVLVSAQMSFANSDTGSATTPCPNKTSAGTIQNVNYEPPVHTVTPASPGSSSAV